MRLLWVLVIAAMVAACGGGDDSEGTCGPIPAGDPDGHPDPLGAGPTEARAGRITAAQLPEVASGMITWQAGDFVIANDKIALVIEDVGDSDLYDPWGGRPVGLARIANHAMVEPNNFGEFFLLTGRSTVLTECVSVINDGSDGGTAVIRASGKLHPLPFFEALTGSLFFDGFEDIDAAIDYELAPGAEEVVIRMRYVSGRDHADQVPSILHAMMYTKRTPVYRPGQGFEDAFDGDEYMALVDDGATSWAYRPGEGTLQGGLSVSGFVGSITAGFEMPRMGTLERIHARLIIGGPGTDGIADAAARTLGHVQRAVTGTVRRGGEPAPGVRVHAVDATTGYYYTRVTTDAAGAYTLHVPTDATVRLDAYRRGDVLATATAGPAVAGADLDIPEGGSIHVVVTDPAGGALPARVQVLPAGGSLIPMIPADYGEGGFANRLHVEFTTSGDVTMPAPVGTWEVVVSRGFEYELHRQTVTVAAGATVEVDATLDRSVATPGVLCGDFHIHTDRSNDSADSARYKVASAVADGLELPVRSDHEWVGDFSAEIAALGVEAWAKGIASVELTSMEIWGHMGVFPLVPDPTQVNAGSPKWQTFPTADQRDTPFTTMNPATVFDTVRARPEAPVIIINHPQGNKDYFGYVGFDAATGMVDVERVAEWDTHFTLVEFFNHSGWQANQGGNVRDWLGINRAGRKVFAVGSSDSHGVSTSPVGFPRTCVDVGTDDPRQVTGPMVRDRMAAGHHTISGGIYVSARVGTASSGDTATGLGLTADVDVVIQAATWVDVDAIDVVVDGIITDTISILPGDADPTNPVIRWSGTIQVPVNAAGGGFVIIAAYGDHELDPVHVDAQDSSRYRPFGVTNPIFLQP